MLWNLSYTLLAGPRQTRSGPGPLSGNNGRTVQQGWGWEMWLSSRGFAVRWELQKWERPSCPQAFLEQQIGREDLLFQLTLATVTVETAQDLVRQTTPQEGQGGQKWHMDQWPSFDARITCNPSWNFNNSWKKRKKRWKEEKLRRLHVKMEVT